MIYKIIDSVNWSSPKLVILIKLDLLCNFIAISNTIRLNYNFVSILLQWRKKFCSSGKLQLIQLLIRSKALSNHSRNCIPLYLNGRRLKRGIHLSYSQVHVIQSGPCFNILTYTLQVHGWWIYETWKWSYWRRGWWILERFI